MHDDEKFVSAFGAYDWSKAPHAPAIYRSTLQRLVTGAATLWNAQGTAFVSVAAMTVASVPAVQVCYMMGRSELWDCNTSEVMAPRSIGIMALQTNKFAEASTHIINHIHRAKKRIFGSNISYIL
jgi:hypothetical protein